jgi:hypothetical protein
MIVRLALTALVLAAGAAHSQTRPQTPSMTCDQTRVMVARAGGIVLGTGGYTYDRYVSDARFCLQGQSIRRQNAPTRDTPYCPLWICYDPSGSWFMRN